MDGDAEMVKDARAAFCGATRTAAAYLANLEVQVREGQPIDEAGDPARLQKLTTRVLETAGALRFAEALAVMRREA